MSFHWSSDRRSLWLCTFFRVIDIGAHLPGDPSSQGKPCLLLVEDQPTEWFFYGDLLSAEYDVKFAMNGEEALAAVQRRLPDLVLSDVLMPLLDGIGLARRLRADSRTANVPIILMTASGASDLPTLGLEAGTTEFLLKPFRPQELLARLRCHWSLTDFPSHPDRV